MRSQRIKKYSLNLSLWALLGLLIMAVPSQAVAGPFTRLQVLLPGETADPGSVAGKIGVPDAQTVGVGFPVILRACDDDWYTVTEVSDAVQWNSTDATADLPGSSLLSAGQMAVTVILNAAGTFTISGQDLSDPTIPEAFSTNVVAVVLSGFRFDEIRNKHQDAGDPFAIEITAIDPSGNTVGGYSGPVNLQEFTSYGLGRVSPATVILDAGVWSGEVTLYRADETNTNRGNVNIYCYLTGDISINGTSTPFLVHPGPMKRIQLVLPGQTPLPGSVEGVTGTPASQGAMQPFTVDLYATDDYWNPLAQGNDVVRIVSTDSGASTPETVTLASGAAQSSLFLATVGAQTLTVNDLSNGAVRSMTTAPIMVIPSYAHHFEFNDLPEAIVAGTQNLVTIRATDGGGNTIPDFFGDAILSANTGPGSISPESITFTNGVWIGIMEFYGAGGAVQVTCADYSTPPHLGTSNAVMVLPGPYVATQIIMPGQTAQGGTATGLVGVADGQDAGQVFTAHVRAVDEYFNRVTGINNSVTFNSPDANISVPAGASLINGEAFIPVTIYMSGTQTLSATDTVSQGIEALASSNFVVAPGPYAKLLLVAPGQTARPGEEDGRIGEATAQSITYLFTVVALATDQWYNQVSGVGDLVHLACDTDPGAELPSDTFLEDGKAFLELRLATGGFQQLVLTSVSTPSTVASNTQVLAISSGLHLVAEIVEDVIQAGVLFTLDVKMVNDAGSTIQEINSPVNLTVRHANSGAAGLGLLSVTELQLQQGVLSKTLTYTKAEPIILHVAGEDGSLPALTDILIVEPGTPSILSLDSDLGWVPANRTAVITAHITDAFENPVPGQEVAFTTAAGDSGSLENQVVKASDKTVVSVTDDAGYARVNYHSPRHAQVARVIASSGQLSAEFDLETALVDPNAAGGYITNYPNPFHPNETNTTIAYQLDDNASVRVRVYTISGSLVLDRQYATGDFGGSAGLNEIQWDGRNGTGEPVASGGYIVYVEAEGNGATQHVMRRKIGVVW